MFGVTSTFRRSYERKSTSGSAVADYVLDQIAVAGVEGGAAFYAVALKGLGMRSQWWMGVSGR